PFAVGDDLLFDSDGVGGAAGLPVGAGEVGAGSQGGGVFGAEEPFAVGDDLLFDSDGVGGAAGLPVGTGEVGTDGQGGLTPGTWTRGLCGLCDGS
ncbi:MAG TPA: hypothetical protein VFV66_35005, partial [Nonomuraea sp.]|nr:hypothetical protein [Nonomuraea sp.]